MSSQMCVSNWLTVLMIIICAIVNGHEHVAYSQENDIGSAQQDWMAELCDSSKITEISIPGTHDTMADEGGSGFDDIVETQTLSLTNQLNAGIRALDIRCAVELGLFGIYHGPYYLHVTFADVLNEVKSFLDAHPTEFILMTVANEHQTDSNKVAFAQKFDYYFNHATYSSYFYRPATMNDIPTVGDVRKRIVVFQNFESTANYGLYWKNAATMDAQDEFYLNDNWALYYKWEKAKTQLIDANTNKNANKFFVNFLSGAGDVTKLDLVMPYFVASGHSNPASGAPRLSTGLTTPGWKDKYPDFPRTACTCALCLCAWECEVCTISFEGTNVLAYDKMNELSFVGIVYADYPGKGLIERIISKNSDEWASNKECGDMRITCNSKPLSRHIDSGETQTFVFENLKQRDVTFTNCDSLFDPQLRLYQSGSGSMMTADNACDGDDCHDARFPCDYYLSETFTFSDLAIGEYRLKINPYSTGGTFFVQIFCGLRGLISIPDVQSGYLSGGGWSSTETVYYLLDVPRREPWVTFTDCDTQFDPKLFLLDSNFATVSDSLCDYDHDDCQDDIRYQCGTSYRETFTVPRLEAGRYFVALTAYVGWYGFSGGNYEIKTLQAVESGGTLAMQSDVTKLDGSGYGMMFNVKASADIRITSIAFRVYCEDNFPFTLYKKTAFGTFVGESVNDENEWEVVCEGEAACVTLCNEDGDCLDLNAKTGQCEADIMVDEVQAFYLYTPLRISLRYVEPTRETYSYHYDIECSKNEDLTTYLSATARSYHEGEPFHPVERLPGCPTISFVYDKFITGTAAHSFVGDLMDDENHSKSNNDYLFALSNRNIYFICFIVGGLLMLTFINICIWKKRNKYMKVALYDSQFESTCSEMTESPESNML